MRLVTPRSTDGQPTSDKQALSLLTANTLLNHQSLLWTIETQADSPCMTIFRDVLFSSFTHSREMERRILSQPLFGVWQQDLSSNVLMKSRISTYWQALLLFCAQLVRLQRQERHVRNAYLITTTSQLQETENMLIMIDSARLMEHGAEYLPQLPITIKDSILTSEHTNNLLDMTSMLAWHSSIMMNLLSFMAGVILTLLQTGKLMIEICRATYTNLWMHGEEKNIHLM